MKKQKGDSTAITSWQRGMLAVSSMLLLGIGAVLASTNLLESGSREYVSGTMMKVGFVLGLLWVAAPQIERLGWQRLRGSMLVAVALVLVLWSIRPKVGAIAGALVVGASLVFSLVGWLRKISALPPGPNQRRD